MSGSRTSVETVVIGAGHAGLIASWHLGQAGREHVVLERRPTLGGGCTLYLQQATMGTIVLVGTSSAGNAAFPIPVPNNPGFAGMRWVGKDQVGYAAAKAGLMHFTKVTAVAYARHGVRQNCVVPGLIFTPLSISSRAGAEGPQAPLTRVVITFWKSPAADVTAALSAAATAVWFGV